MPRIDTTDDHALAHSFLHAFLRTEGIFNSRHLYFLLKALPYLLLSHIPAPHFFHYAYMCDFMNQDHESLTNGSYDTSKLIRLLDALIAEASHLSRLA